MKNKKGSHVGIILSFIIFILFLVFAYTIIGPVTNISNSKTYSLKYLEKNSLNELSENIFVINSYDSASQGDCLQTSSMGYTDAIVLDEENNELPRKIESGNIKIPSKQGFSKILFSDYAFDPTATFSPTSCDSLEIYSSLNESRIFEKKIIYLISNITSNYSDTKERLGFLDEDINMRFDYMNGTEIGQKTNQNKTSIYSKEILVNYLSNKGEEKSGRLIFEIW